MNYRKLLLSLGLGGAMVAQLSADVRMPKIFSDSMVLQRETASPVWGWADDGEKVTVEFAGQKKEAVADENGKWMIKLDSLSADKNPRQITVRGRNTITFEDVVVGDVWICGGQSNMEYPIGNYKPEIPHVRLFHMTPHKGLTEKDDFVDGSWSACSPYSVSNPQNIQCFSHVGFLFGKELQEKTGVPIGLIDNSRAGTIAEAWTRMEGMEGNPDYKSGIEKMAECRKGYNGLYAAGKAKEEKVWSEMFPKGDDSKGLKEGWQRKDFDDSGWETVRFSDKYEESNPPSLGPGWLRKKVVIPESWQGKDVVFSLGRIAQTYDLYIDGKLAASTGNTVYGAWAMPYSGTIPAGIIKPGVAVIAVYALGHSWKANPVPDSKRMGVRGDLNPKNLISLEGEWKFKEESPRTEAEAAKFAEELKKSSNWGERRDLPSYLYNVLTAPLVPFAIRGVVWYQGESNVERSGQYRSLLSSLITGWRKAWGQGDFAFLIVQLPSYDTDPAPGPGCKGPWYELREAQLQTLELPKTAMAVTIDIGDPKQLHPNNKTEVAHRLALAALGSVYGKDIVYSGPIYKSMKIAGNTVRLSFKHVGGGLMAKDGDLMQFQIAGDDKKFVPAKAVIDVDTVLVSNESVKSPMAVRYAWANNPAGCNLYNKDGLPASPFRTDNW